MTDLLHAAQLDVLMPVFNAQDDAWRTLAALDEPALARVRVLIVDDGSTPPFVAPPPSRLAANVFVEVLRLSPNGGIEKALAAGAQMLMSAENGGNGGAVSEATAAQQPESTSASASASASATSTATALAFPGGAADLSQRFIARLDAGDIPLPAARTAQLAYLLRHPRVGAVGMAVDVVNRAGDRLYTLRPPLDPDTIRRQCFARSCFIHPAMTIRASALADAGSYTDAYPAAEDLDLFLRIMRRHDCANLPIVGLRYEINENGISATRRRQQIHSTLRLFQREWSLTQASNPFYWLGVAKHLVHRVMPYTVLQRFKRLAFGGQQTSQASAAPNAAPAAGLHLCLVSNTAWSIYNYRQGLLQTLLAQKARITIIAPEDRTFALLREMGCECVPLRMASKGTRPLQDGATLRQLFGLYRRLRPDVVFHYTIKPNIYGTLAAALARVPSVAVTTGLGYVFLHDTPAARVARGLYRMAFRFPREVWFLNPDDRRAFLDGKLLAHPERARLLRGEGVDLHHFQMTSPPTSPPFRFLLIGRLLWDKGVGEFVAAARLLRPDFPDVEWQLLGPVGVENPSAISQKEVQAWVDEGVVRYLGEAHDVRPAIADAACIVLPSYREGVPRTLMEAAAMGRIAIATRVPGCVEVVEDQVNGILCEVRNIAGLAEAMRAVLTWSSARRREAEHAARRKAEREFDERVVLQQYQRTLSDITGRTFSVELDT
jgi:glycosyltransferase involved in cell wall biosynthesis